MHKRTHISLHLEPHEKPLVKKGDHVKRGDKLITATAAAIVEFNLISILNVPPSDLIKYLLVKENQKVKIGEVIARKKKMFSTHTVKSPIFGTFVIIDRDKGKVGVKETQSEQTVSAWFDGDVTDVNDQEIVLSVNGHLVSGTKGVGKLASGILHVAADDINTLTMPIDLEQAILVVKVAASEIIAKADTLGAVGIVAETIAEPNFVLPYLLLSDITEIHKFHKKQAILYADRKQLLILEEDTTDKGIPKK